MIENKFKIIFTALLAGVLVSCVSSDRPSDVVAAPKLDAVGVKMYNTRMIPAPKNAEFKQGNFYRITDDCKIKLVLPSAVVDSCDVEEIVENVCKQYWDFSVDVDVEKSKDVSNIKRDGYKLDISGDVMKISASNVEGVRNALKTARQLSETERGVTNFSAYVIPQMKIDDYPSMQFRGVHLCYFPQTTHYEFLRAIRLASYYKMNYVIVEFWGTYNFKKYPEFCVAENALSDEQIDEIKALGKELGITIIPLFNMVGHASLAREITGKHAILYKHKNLQNHFEPEGWSWCISNPDTKKMLVDMMLDLHERFDNPPFFHIGFDESYEIATCSLCRNTGTPAELLKNHIESLHSIMKERGTRIMIWHDMLLDKKDPRWKGYKAGANVSQNLSMLLDKLPKDIIIADWQYRANPKEPNWPTAKYFTDNGFDTLLCPWLSNNGIISQGKFVASNKLYGMLLTTWGQMQFPKLQKIFTQGATSEWGAPELDLDNRNYRMSYNHHIQQLDLDMGCEKYENAGYSNNEDLKFLFHDWE